MKIFCPSCQAIGRIEDRWQGKEIRCPKCSQVFVAGQSEERPPEQVEPQPATKEEALPATGLTLDFKGTGREFFPLWFSSLLLIIVTGGLYTPWAKVKIRRYFYGHTSITGIPFDYKADPLLLLRGYLLVLAGLVFYWLINATFPRFAMALVLVAALLMPWLLHNSHRLSAASTSFQSFPFLFRGSLSQAYLVYLVLPLLIPFSLGILLPYWAYEHKKYTWGNLAFAGIENEFSGRVGYFYTVYGRALLMTMALACPLAGTYFFFGFADKEVLSAGQDGAVMGAALLVLIAFVYLSLLLFSAVIQQYIAARITNYCLQHSQFASLSFQATLRARDLMWIRLSNILLLLTSLGLFLPWARMRRHHYVLSRLHLQFPAGLEKFMTRASAAAAGPGIWPASPFDIDIGL